MRIMTGIFVVDLHRIIEFLISLEEKKEKVDRKKGGERRASGHKEMRLTRRNVSKGKLKPNEVCVTLNRSLWRG